MPEERLQKILAHAGIASRRRAEQLLLEGRITVNGQVVTELGTKADLGRDHIKVDGKLVRKEQRHVYLALNKPRDVVTTLSDPQGRATILDILKGVKERVYPVGRLDYHSEGLLLLTNDGDLAARVMAPRTHLQKTYVVKVKGHLTFVQEDQFRAGVPIQGRRTSPAALKLIKEGENPWYEVKLIEGRQNQIRQMFKHFGKLVEKLKRIRIGPLSLGPLPPGEFRHLTKEEVEKLKRATRPAPTRPPAAVP
jgi:23S rRNA pseudouridine2605 synthase